MSSILLFCMSALSGPASAEVIAIKAGTLLDPASGAAVKDAVVLVKDGRITAAGPDVRVPARATVVDLSDAFVMPGLIDAHTHLCTEAELRVDHVSQVYDELARYEVSTGVAERALVGAASARSMLEAGFTTVRDLGNAGAWADTALREAIEVGRVPGPTVLNAGLIIGPRGGQLHGIDDALLEGSHYLRADTDDEMVAAVRLNLYHGAQWIKLLADDQPYAYSADAMRVAVAEAGRAGVKVAAHAGSDEQVRAAVEAGVASVEHGFGASDATLALMAERGVPLVGTPFGEAVLATFASVSSAEYMAAALGRGHAAGVTLVFGSDVYARVDGMDRGEATLSTLDAWAASGVPNEVTLQALTVNAAALLGLDDRGHVRVGAAADLIAMPRDPRTNLDALESVAFVMKGGEIIVDR